MTLTPEQIRQQVNDHADRIAAKRDLTTRAKQIHVARKYVEARDALNQLRQDDIASVDTKRRMLERRLYGSDGATVDPSAAISRRDARDRAAAIDKPELAEYELARAERSGDEHLAQAIAAEAADRGWTGALQQYVNTRPEAADTVQQLLALPDTRQGAYQMTKAIEYSIAPPAILAGHSEASINMLARQPLESDAPTG